MLLFRENISKLGRFYAACMIRLIPIIFLSLLISTTATAQKKKISLEEIWRGKFRTEGLAALTPLKNGQEYSILNYDPYARKSSIDSYSYTTSEKTATLLSSDDIPGVNYIANYQFSDEQERVLVATEVNPIYRYSARGVYYVYHLDEKTVVRVAEEKIQEPTFSPGGAKLAYALDNNLFILDLASSQTIQITSDGNDNQIINGIADWVYEEELKMVRAFEWNSTAEKIAYLRFDESEVPLFSMDIYGEALYPDDQTFKYPKAGEKNSDVSLHIYDLTSGVTQEIHLDDYEYIPRIQWMKDPDLLTVQTLNREQNRLKIHQVNTEDYSVKVILEETDAAYVDVTDDLKFLEDDSFLWTSERDGFNHLYHYNSDGSLKRQVTKGPWELTKLYGYDPDSRTVYYQSTENGSINRDVYGIGLNGKSKRRLSPKTGTNDADFSADFSYFINAHSSATEPFSYSLYETRSGNLVREIKNNNDVLAKLKEYQLSPKEYSTIAINGNELNMWMVKPPEFDPEKKYPLLLYQYSGPGSQEVENRWLSSNDLWHQMLASEGYVIACVDGRGTGYKGRDFKKVTYLNLVKYETEDQIEVARTLSNLPYIDENRTGIWGWSFGGHMSTNCLLKGSDVFEMAIAVAPVTNWRFYDTIYTERFMRTPQENPSGYDDNSPFNYPELLEGDYLLIHGSADDNVHVQNSMRMIEALVQANKPFDWAIYPDKNHSIYGGNTRLHLYNKMTNFIKNNL